MQKKKKKVSACREITFLFTLLQRFFFRDRTQIIVD